MIGVGSPRVNKKSSPPSPTKKNTYCLCGGKIEQVWAFELASARSIFGFERS